MSVPAHVSSRTDLAAPLAAIAAGAGERDAAAAPAFPADSFAALAPTGVLSWNARAGTERPPAAEELVLVRAVARADGSVGRIFDGHLNAPRADRRPGP